MHAGPQSSEDFVRVCCIVSRSRRDAKAGGAAGTARVLRLTAPRGTTVSALCSQLLRHGHVRAGRVYVGGRRAQKDDLLLALRERHGGQGGQLDVRVVEEGARSRRPAAAGPGEEARAESAAGPAGPQRGRLQELLAASPGRVPVKCRLAGGGARGEVAKVLVPPGMLCSQLASTCRALLEVPGGALGGAALRVPRGAELDPGGRVGDLEALRSPDGVLRLSLAAGVGAPRARRQRPRAGPPAGAVPEEAGAAPEAGEAGGGAARPARPGGAGGPGGALAGGAAREAERRAAAEQLAEVRADRVRKAIADNFDSRQQAVLQELVRQVGALRQRQEECSKAASEVTRLVHEFLHMGHAQANGDKQSVVSEILVGDASGSCGSSVAGGVAAGSIASKSTDGDGLDDWFWMNPESPSHTP